MPRAKTSVLPSAQETAPGEAVSCPLREVQADQTADSIGVPTGTAEEFAASTFCEVAGTAEEFAASTFCEVVSATVPNAVSVKIAINNNVITFRFISTPHFKADMYTSARKKTCANSSITLLIH